VGQVLSFHYERCKEDEGARVNGSNYLLIQNYNLLDYTGSLFGLPAIGLYFIRVPSGKFTRLLICY